MKLSKRLKDNFDLIFRPHRVVKLGDRGYLVRRFLANEMALNPGREDWWTHALESALKSKDGAFIDVGANAGQTLLKLLSLAPDRDYIGFEPQPECVHCVKSFIADNELHHHLILSVGLSNKSQVVPLLRRRQGADQTASIVSGFRPGDFYNGQDHIYTATGDEVLESIGVPSIAVIKVDVEGAELEVLDGLYGSIEKFRPIIFFEVLSNFLRVTGQSLNPDLVQFRDQRTGALESLVREAGYSIFNVLPGRRLVEVSKIEPGTSSDGSVCDYVAVHSTDIEDFLEGFRGEKVLI